MHRLANEIIREAHLRVGKPYRHQGRGPEYFDCAGVVVDIGHTLKLGTHDSTDYAKRPNAQAFRRHLLEGGCVPIPMNQMASGDIFRLATRGVAVHCAIYEVDEHGQEWIIHAWAPAKKVVREQLTDARREEIADVMRYPGA